MLVTGRAVKTKSSTFIHSKKTAQLIHSKRETISKDLVASWTVHVGDMDQVLHLWRYTGGFAKIDKAEALLSDDAVSIPCILQIECIRRN